MTPEWFGAGGGVIVAAIALCGVMASLARRARRHTERRFGEMLSEQLGDFLADWKGAVARPGVDARPGVMERLQSVEKITGEIRTETRPNGGSSLRDAVDRVGDDLAAHRRATSPAIKTLSEDVAGVRARLDQLEGKPVAGKKTT